MEGMQRLRYGGFEACTRNWGKGQEGAWCRHSCKENGRRVQILGHGERGVRSIGLIDEDMLNLLVRQSEK
jgi:hypothetical protein